LASSIVEIKGQHFLTSYGKKGKKEVNAQGISDIEGFNQRVYGA
jgi:hypothetical protein